MLIRNLFIITAIALSLLVGGCAQSTENSQALHNSKLPWGKPANWTTNQPIAPGFSY